MGFDLDTGENTGWETSEHRDPQILFPERVEAVDDGAADVIPLTVGGKRTALFSVFSPRGTDPYAMAAGKEAPPSSLRMLRPGYTGHVDVSRNPSIPATTTPDSSDIHPSRSRTSFKIKKELSNNARLEQRRLERERAQAKQERAEQKQREQGRVSLSETPAARAERLVAQSAYQEITKKQAAENRNLQARREREEHQAALERAQRVPSHLSAVPNWIRKSTLSFEDIMEILVPVIESFEFSIPTKKLFDDTPQSTVKSDPEKVAALREQDLVRIKKALIFKFPKEAATLSPSLFSLSPDKAFKALSPAITKYKTAVSRFLFLPPSPYCKKEEAEKCFVAGAQLMSDIATALNIPSPAHYSQVMHVCCFLFGKALAEQLIPSFMQES
ncbi:MAG: hypothetical protein WCW30_01075 [Candidatus Gracilibacteria bacterium]